jgi:hypothetical protein
VNGGLYEKIIQLKTGVLFGAACRLGAVAARVTGARQAAWQRFGLRIGEAYQIADDLHDVKQYLLTRSIRPAEIAALAPALLSFAQEIRSPLLEAAHAGLARLNGQLLPYFEGAAASMTAEIERRLRAAGVEIEEQLPDNGYARLAREAPQSLIAMFNAASSPASAR